jgi:hypothetical protein
MPKADSEPEKFFHTSAHTSIMSFRWKQGMAISTHGPFTEIRLSQFARNADPDDKSGNSNQTLLQIRKNFVTL